MHGMRIAVPITAGVAFLAGILLWYGRETPKTPPELSPERPRPTAPQDVDRLAEGFRPATEPAGAKGLKYGMKPGDVLTYRFELMQRIALSLGALLPVRGAETATETEFKAQVAGEYDLECWREGGFAFRFRSVEASQEVSGRRQPFPPHLKAQLTSDVLVKMTPEGEMSEMAFAPTIEAEARNMLRSVILQTRFILSGGPAATWEREEEDMSGTYVARYEVPAGLTEAEGPIVRVLRTRTRYTDVRVHTAMPVPPQRKSLPSGQATLFFDPKRGIARAFRIEEGLEVEIPRLGQRIRTKAHGEVPLRAERRDEDLARSGAVEWEKALKDRAWVSASQAESVQDVMRRIQREQWQKDLEGVTLEDLLSTLNQLAESGKATSEEAYFAVQKLITLLRLDDAAAPAVLEAQRNGTLKPEAGQLVVGAFGSAGTRACQQALLDFVDDARLPQDLRELSLAAYSQVEDPLPSVLRHLQDLVQSGREPSLEGTALLALGVFAGRLKSSAPDEADALADFLLSQREHRSDRTWTGTVLGAMGNAGNPRTLDFVLEMSASQDPSIRAEAVDAMKRVKDSKVVAHLPKALQEDSSPEVRAAAVRAMDAQGPLFNGEVSRALASDPDPSVRREALAYFGRRMAEDPSARTRVQEAAALDASDEVRGFAQQALSSQ